MTVEDAKIERSFPVDFNLRNKQGQHILFIRDENQTVQLEIENTSAGFVTIPTRQVSAEPDEDELIATRQFYLILPVGTIFEPRAIEVRSPGWRILFDEKRSQVHQAWFLWRVDEPIELGPRERETLTLANVSVDGAGGSRGSRAELDYHGLEFGVEAKQVSGHRTHYIGIMDELGEIPFEGVFEREGMLLNSAGTLNRPVLRITNRAGSDLPLNDNSTIEVRFPLITRGQPHGLIKRSDESSVRVLSIKQTTSDGEAHEWLPVAERPNVLSEVPGSESFFWPPIRKAAGPAVFSDGDTIDIGLEFQTTGSTGPTFIEVTFLEFGTFSGSIVIPAFRSPAVVREMEQEFTLDGNGNRVLADDGRRVGIRTDVPRAALDVASGGVRVGTGGLRVESALKVEGDATFGRTVSVLGETNERGEREDGVLFAERLLSRDLSVASAQIAVGVREGGEISAERLTVTRRAEMSRLTVTSGAFAAVFRRTSSGVGPPSVQIFGTDGTRNRISLLVQGKVMAQGTVFGSDARVKRDLEPLDRTAALANVNRLRPCEYTLDPAYGDDSGRQRGFVAQEVEEVLPQAVSHVGEQELQDGKTLEDFLAVDYQEILTEAVAAIQQLSARVEELETRLAAVEK